MHCFPPSCSLSFDLYAVGSAPKQALENRVKVLHWGSSPRLTSVSGMKDPLSLFISPSVPKGQEWVASAFPSCCHYL